MTLVYSQFQKNSRAIRIASANIVIALIPFLSYFEISRHAEKAAFSGIIFNLSLVNLVQSMLSLRFEQQIVNSINESELDIRSTTANSIMILVSICISICVFLLYSIKIISQELAVNAVSILSISIFLQSSYVNFLTASFRQSFIGAFFWKGIFQASIPFLLYITVLLSKFEIGLQIAGTVCLAGIILLYLTKNINVNFRKMHLPRKPKLQIFSEISFGFVNNLWVNLPNLLFNSLADKSQAIAFFLLQKTVSAPLNLIGQSVLQLLLSAKNKIHTNGKAVQSLSVKLLISGGLYSLFVVLIIYTNPFGFFSGINSRNLIKFVPVFLYFIVAFAASALSILIVKLSDEIWANAWQIIATIGAICVFFASQYFFSTYSVTFVSLFFALSYLILPTRWIYLIKKRNRND